MNITRFNPQSPANAGHQMYPYVSYATKQYIPASKFTPCQGDREVHKKREKQMLTTTELEVTLAMLEEQKDKAPTDHKEWLRGATEVTIMLINQSKKGF